MTESIQLNGDYCGIISRVRMEGRVMDRRYVITLDQPNCSIVTTLTEDEVVKLRNWLNKVV